MHRDAGSSAFGNPIRSHKGLKVPYDSDHHNDSKNPADTNSLFSYISSNITPSMIPDLCCQPFQCSPMGKNIFLKNLLRGVIAANFRRIWCSDFWGWSCKVYTHRGSLYIPVEIYMYIYYPLSARPHPPSLKTLPYDTFRVHSQPRTIKVLCLLYKHTTPRRITRV